MKAFLVIFCAAVLSATGAQNDAVPSPSDSVFDPQITRAAEAGGQTNRPGTLLTNAVLLVTPKFIDFGQVAPHKSATNSFMVQNVGGGKLLGKATVAPPFLLLDGEYVLRPNEAQLLTIVYAPKGASTGSNEVRTVTFTGGGGAKAKVGGRH